MTKKVLILEDNESYSAILGKKLAIEEFDVITAASGIEAIKKGAEFLPDIILIDLLLPEMNGIQVMEELRKNEWGRHMPLLILTNLNPDDLLLQRISRNKPADYLIKSEVTLDNIVEKIRIILQNPRDFI